jgi:5-methylcytosine-specific restriction endonuclease McrA
VKRIALSDINLLDIGNEIVMVGAVYQGKGLTFTALFPDETLDDYPDEMLLTREEWETLLRQADHLDTEVDVTDADGMIRKAILRKSQRLIDTHAAAFVYERDGHRCRYCGKGGIPLTVDHLVLWEEQGPSTPENLVASCRKDNKTRGRMQYADWLRFPYYLKVSQALTPAQRVANEALLATLDSIPRVARQRSR